MLQVIESTTKEDIPDILKKYPHSKCVIRLDAVKDNEGYLLAVSTDKSSYNALCAYVEGLDDSLILAIEGEYINGGALGVQYLTE